MLATKLGLLYSGQGSQVTSLGKDFYDTYPSVKLLYDTYPDIRDMAFYGSETEIAQTQNTQPILILFQVAITNLLREFLPYHAAMGLSLGEYGALYGAGVLSAPDVIAMIGQRAKAMADEIKGRNLSSVAVLNSDFTWLRKNAGPDSYYISNINSPSQMVITGENLDTWVEKIKAQAYKKIIPLAVSGGFHSPYIKQTEDLLTKLFKSINFAPPKIPIFYNYGPETMDIKQRMAEQVSHTINVHQALNQITNYADILIEIGANGILQSMVKKINRQTIVYPLSKLEDFEKVRSHLGK